MKVCFLKGLTLIDGFGQELSFEAKKFYNLTDELAIPLIEQGYCFQYGFMSELKSTLYIPRGENK
jgi:hypothetical protein